MTNQIASRTVQFFGQCRRRHACEHLPKLIHTKPRQRRVRQPSRLYLKTTKNDMPGVRDIRCAETYYAWMKC